MKKRALLVLAPILGALFLLARPVLATDTYTIGFDGGGDISYSIITGSIQATGNPGNALEGAHYGDGAHYDYVVASTRAELPSTCGVGATIAVSVDVKYYQTSVHPGYYGLAVFGETTIGGSQQSFINTYNDGHTRSVWETRTSGNITLTQSTNYVVFTGYYWEIPSDYLRIDNLSISCTPLAPQPEYSSDPTNSGVIDLGSAEVSSTTTDPEALTITNTGDSQSILTVLGGSITGTNAGDFTLNTTFPHDVTIYSALTVSISCTPGGAGARTATLTISSNDSDESQVSYTLQCFGGAPGGSGWTQLIKSPEEAAAKMLDSGVAGFRAKSPFAELDQSGAQSVLIAYSAAVGAPVHSMRAGTVSSVTKISGQCVNNVIFSGSVSESCSAADEAAIGVDVSTLAGLLKGWVLPGLPVIAIPQLHLIYTDAFLINVAAEGGDTLYYVVGTPKVAAGDTVAAGCVLGVTLPFKYSDATPGELTHETPNGWAMAQARNAGDVWYDIKSSLTETPNGAACTAVNSNCKLVYNAGFANQAEGWILAEDKNGHRPSMDYRGGIIPAGYVRSRDISLDGATQYTIELRYHVTAWPYYGFSVQLGASTALSVFQDGATDGSIVWKSTPATYTAGANGLYQLVLSAGNDGVSDPRVAVDFACIYESTGTNPPAPAGGCLLLDPELDKTLDTSPWDGSSDPPAFGAAGLMIIPDGGWIKQSLTLHPKSGGSQGYKLWIEWRRQGAPQTDHHVSLDWEYDTASGTFGPSTAQNWQTDTDTFTIAADTTADLTITASGSHTTEAAQINRICVTTGDGSLPPGYDPPGPGGDIACRICTYNPVGDLATDFSDYVSWLGCRLTQLWDCQLKIVLYGILQAITDVLTLLAFILIWLAAVIQGAIGWANGNLLVSTRWVGGQLQNLGIIFQNSLTNLRSFSLTTSGGAGFWDAIVSIANAIRSIVGDLIAGIGTPIIGLLQQIVTGLFGALAGLLGLIGTILTIAFMWLSTQAAILVSLLSNTIKALYEALSTASVQIPPGAPTCQAPGTFLYIPCLGFYILDNTIFSGPIVYVIPVFMGLNGFRVLLWAARRVKNTFAG